MRDLTSRGSDDRLELRLRRIESRLGLLEGNLTQTLALPSSNADDALTITGLAIAKGVGSLTVTWDEVSGNVKEYLVQLSTDTSFSAPDKEVTTRETRAVFSPGTDIGETTYYARVKVTLTDGTEGPFTSSVNDTPGQAGTVDIEDAAIETAKIADLAVETAKIQDLAVETLKIGENAVTVPSGAFTAGQTSGFSAETEIQSVALTVDDSNAPLLIWTTFEAIASTSTTWTVRIKRDSTEIFQGSAVNVNTNPSIFNYDLIETPGTGTFDYSVTVEPGSGSGHKAQNRSMLVASIKK